MGGLNTSELPAYRFKIFWLNISSFLALFYFQTFHSIIMNISPRLPYDVINFEIDLMKDLGVKIEHGRWPSQLLDFSCLEELRVWSWSCQPGEADHEFKYLFISFFKCSIFNPDTLEKATSLLSRWKRTLEQVFILLNIFFLMWKIFPNC